MFSTLKKRNKKHSKKASHGRRRRPLFEKLERRELLSSVSWSVGPSLPAARSDAVALLAPDDAVIVLGGNATNATSVPKLSSGAAGWTSAHDLENERTGPGGSIVAGNEILVYGGLDGNEGSDEVLAYDYGFGDSQDADKLAIGRSDFGYATDEAFRAYAIGGLEKEGDQVLDSVERYDAGADLWSPIANLPSPRRGVAAVGDNAGNIYVFGGIATPNGNVIQDTSFRYTISSDSWDTVAPMPVGTADSAVVQADDGSIYVLGGRSSSGVIATVQEYNPATDTWTTNTDLPIAVHSQAATIDDTGHIVVIGGVNSAGDKLASVFRSQRLDIPDSAPEFVTSPMTTGSLESPYSYDVHASGNPAATYTLELAPAGMTIDSATGLISWQPVVGLHGEQSVTVRAQNQIGFADQSFVIDTPVTAPQFTSAPRTTASLDGFYNYSAAASGSPLAAYTLVAGPTGMTVDAQSGLVTWQPLEGQQGQQSVTLRAENFVGSDEQSFVIDVVVDTIAPSAPALLNVDGVGTSTIDLSWQPASDNRGVEYYEVLKGYRSGWRGRNTSYRVIATGIAGTSTTLTQLDPLSSHKLKVRAVDFGGNFSPLSNQVIAQTQAPPTLRHYTNGRINGQVSVVANQLLEINIAATANPSPTYSIVSGPATMAIDPASGLLQWTPTAADVGIYMVVVEGVNSVGTGTLEVPIMVAADMPVLTVSFSGLSIAGVPLEIQFSDISHTPSTFELINGPVTATIDAATGLVQWAPTSADAGPTSITVRGANSAGNTDRTITFETFFTPEPTDIQVSGETLFYPTVSWTAPVGEGVDNIAGYSITARARYRSGRAWRTHTVTMDVPGTGTSAEIEGLRTGREYAVWVNAYDSAGHRSARSTEPVTMRSVPALPVVTRTVTNPNGGPIVANQPVEIQLTNVSADPAVFSLVDGPTGLTFDSGTGLATWTPGVDNIGAQLVTFRATNSVGPRDVAVSFNVFFSGGVLNVTAVKSGTTATVTWSAPTDNVIPVESYLIARHWRWSSRRRSQTIVVDGSQLSATVGLYPTGAVWHRGVTITPIDEFGRRGVTSSLIPYIG